VHTQSISNKIGSSHLMHSDEIQFGHLGVLLLFCMNGEDQYEYLGNLVTGRSAPTYLRT